jgi:hypothetical protein
MSEPLFDGLASDRRQSGAEPQRTIAILLAARRQSGSRIDRYDRRSAAPERPDAFEVGPQCPAVARTVDVTHERVGVLAISLHRESAARVGATAIVGLIETGSGPRTHAGNHARPDGQSGGREAAQCTNRKGVPSADDEQHSRCKRDSDRWRHHVGRIVRLFWRDAKSAEPQSPEDAESFGQAIQGGEPPTRVRDDVAQLVVGTLETAAGSARTAIDPELRPAPLC